MYEPKDDINYFALTVVIVVGVAAGNLLSNWVTAKVIEVQVQLATAEATKALNRQIRSSQDAADARARLTAEAAAASEQEIRQLRSLDKHGVRLAQTCNEWRKAESELNSYTTKIEATKHCERYDRYIATGALPPPR